VDKFYGARWFVIFFSEMHDSGYLYHVRWVTCHHGMARPQVADGGEGLQIWRVAANILNKQSRQPTRDGPPAWGLSVGLTTPHRKKRACYENS
jgi:hypothetical protein